MKRHFAALFWTWNEEPAMKFRKILLLPFALFEPDWIFAGVQGSWRFDQTKEKLKKKPFRFRLLSGWLFDIDLKYLVKYNNYRIVSVGFWGVTNERLLRILKLAGMPLMALRTMLQVQLRRQCTNFKNNDWVSLYYTKDIREIGSYEYLTSARVYSVLNHALSTSRNFTNTAHGGRGYNKSFR